MLAFSTCVLPLLFNSTTALKRCNSCSGNKKLAAVCSALLGLYITDVASALHNSAPLSSLAFYTARVCFHISFGHLMLAPLVRLAPLF